MYKKKGGKRRILIATSGSPCSLLKEYFCSQDADARRETPHSNKRESLLFAERIFLLPRRRCKTKEENKVAESYSPSLSCLYQPHTCHAPGRRTGSDEKFPLAPRLKARRELEVLSLDKAQAHTNAACVLASFSFAVCPSFAKENGQYFQIHL
jgi:hypothetical protein